MVNGDKEDVANQVAIEERNSELVERERKMQEFTQVKNRERKINELNKK